MAVKGAFSRHPQEAIHASSLVKNGVDGPDDNAAQQFWLNASRGLKWFQRPSVVCKYPSCMILQITLRIGVRTFTAFKEGYLVSRRCPEHAGSIRRAVAVTHSGG